MFWRYVAVLKFQNIADVGNIDPRFAINPDRANLVPVKDEGNKLAVHLPAGSAIASGSTPSSIARRLRYLSKDGLQR